MIFYLSIYLFDIWIVIFYFFYFEDAFLAEDEIEFIKSVFINALISTAEKDLKNNFRFEKHLAAMLARKKEKKIRKLIHCDNDNRNDNNDNDDSNNDSNDNNDNNKNNNGGSDNENDNNDSKDQFEEKLTEEQKTGMNILPYNPTRCLTRNVLRGPYRINNFYLYYPQIHLFYFLFIYLFIYKLIY